MPVVSYLPTEILDYLGTHESETDGSFGVGQRELAKALGYHPCSMSRPLSELASDGLVSVRRAPVRGGMRKQLVYQLTASGRAKLARSGSDVPLLGTALPPPPNPFVGRRLELREFLDFATNGGVIIHVEGESGMGKTAVVSRAIRRLRPGRASFWFTVRAVSSPRHFTSALAHSLSSVGSRQLAYYSQLPREPIGREVADLVGRALGERALVGVIDDAQAATPDTRAFLSDFAQALIQSRTGDVLVFLSQEPSFLPIDAANLHHIRLQGLDRTAAHTLTDKKGGLGGRFEEVYRTTHGNPLLLQLAVSAPEAEISVTALPAAVIGQLSEGDLRSTLLLATSNEPIPLGLASEFGRTSMDRMNQLIHLGVIQRGPEGRAELPQAVRGAVLGRADPLQVKAAHLELANFYGRSHRPESVRERFLHLVQAESWRAAGEMVGRQDAALLANGFSGALQGALHRLGTTATQETARVAALRAEAQLLRLHSDYAEAIRCLQRAVLEARRDPRTQAECSLAMVELFARVQDIPSALNAIEAAKRGGIVGRRLPLLLAYAEARVAESKGDLVLAREGFGQTFENASRSGQQDVALEALARWSRLASMTSSEPEAILAMIENGIPAARSTGRMDVVFALMSVRARIYAETHQPQLAMAETHRIRSESEALGFLSQLVYALSGLSAMAAELGNWEDGISYARQAAELSEKLGNQLIFGHTLALQCNFFGRVGRYQEAVRFGKSAIGILEELTPSDSLPIAHAYLAEVYCNIGDFSEARRHYEIAVAVFGTLGMTTWKDRFVAEIGPKLVPQIGART